MHSSWCASWDNKETYIAQYCIIFFKGSERNMKINQKKSGVILSYLSQVIQILSGLLYTPIMLRLLGQSEYGLYQLVYSVVSYLSLLSFGFTASYMRFYSRARAKNDLAEVGRLNGMFMTIFMAIAVICILCGIVMIENIELIFRIFLLYSCFIKYSRS